MNWDDLRVVLAICREGSLSGAAKVLGTSHSTVFRQINAIEKKLSTRFFNRLSHGYEMTEAGETVMHRATSIEEDILDLERELKSKDLRLNGKIRLTAPEGLSNYLLIPHLASFYQNHPDIQIELMISSDDLQLSQHQADIAVRTTKKPPPNCIGKKVCDFNIGIYATESYLQKVKHLDFPQYDYLLINNGVNWFPPPYWSADAPPKIVFKSDNVSSVTRAASQGLGAVILPCFIGEKELLLKTAALPFKGVSELWILTHPDLRQTARVKALMEHLHLCLSKEKELIEGSY
ncbi:MAG: LysR family transcriptional regulator [Gammaproteobacteria bacterium]|nr:LysR family transcriptional regulator [Gammaproteobacteria bacterium]